MNEPTVSRMAHPPLKMKNYFHVRFCRLIFSSCFEKNITACKIECLFFIYCPMKENKKSKIFAKTTLFIYPVIRYSRYANLQKNSATL